MADNRRRHCILMDDLHTAVDAHQGYRVDPVCVIPSWIAILIVDKLIAGKIPAWSLGPEQHGTIVGALINLALFLALLFWPGGDHEHPMPTLGDTRRKTR